MHGVLLARWSLEAKSVCDCGETRDERFPVSVDKLAAPLTIFSF
jgi:hypothetical protein